MNEKRHTLKKLTGAGAIASILPKAWIKPVVNSVVLPTHAQTSTLIYHIGTYGFINDYGHSRYEGRIDLKPEGFITFRYEQNFSGMTKRWYASSRYLANSNQIYFLAYPCDGNDFGNYIIIRG